MMMMILFIPALLWRQQEIWVPLGYCSVSLVLLTKPSLWRQITIIWNISFTDGNFDHSMIIETIRNYKYHWVVEVGTCVNERYTWRHNHNERMIYHTFMNDIREGIIVYERYTWTYDIGKRIITTNEGNVCECMICKGRIIVSVWYT